jgi:hypothetical protein
MAEFSKTKLVTRKADDIPTGLQNPRRGIWDHEQT